MQPMPHTGVGLVGMVVLACRLVGVAAAERDLVRKGPRVSPAEIVATVLSVCRRRCAPCAARRSCARTGP